MGLKWSTQMNIFTSKVMDASDIIHDIHGLHMPLWSVGTVPLVIDLDDILLQSLYNDFAHKKTNNNKNQTKTKNSNKTRTPKPTIITKTPFIIF